MRRVRIAIIDSGVRADHPAFKGHEPKIIRFSGLGVDEGRCGHGTAIYNIIKKTESFADIINFQITDADEEIDDGMLLACLQKINDEYDVDIINVSLGLSLCDHITELHRICDALSANGVTIVSAFDNLGSISYPAAFQSVVGVTSVEICRKTNDFIVIDDDVINIGANGNIQRLAWDSPDYIIYNGNSFACAHVTVEVARFISEGAEGFEEIIKCFRKKAIQPPFELSNNTQKKPLFKMEKAVLFPFNKEMHSLIRFYDQLQFELNGVFDIRESFHVGSTTDHVMNTDVKSFPIKNVNEIDWDLFDTLIVGNIPLQNAPVLSKARDAIVQEAISLGKKIFSFDDLRERYDYELLYSPAVDLHDLPPERFGKLYRISRPVVGIYGTGSSQGKFTLQLMLRKKFLDEGYTVGQIGTEPSAQLFGMDYAYPMGFNSSVYIDGHDAVTYINDCINALCLRDCDVIITGSQASVLPPDTGNKRMFPLKQFSFLMGTQPDCMILCVNPQDELDYIRRTISFLESSVDGKVISICVYPMKYKGDWTGMYNQKEALSETDFQILKKTLYKEFSVAVYQLGNEDDMAQIFDGIVSFFSCE